MTKLPNAKSQHDAKWKERFRKLLHLTFKTYSLDPVAFQAETHYSTRTYDSWRNGRSLPSPSTLHALQEFVSRHVKSGPCDKAAYDFVRKQMGSKEDLAIYERMVRAASGVGEFLSLALGVFCDKARGGDGKGLLSSLEIGGTGCTQAVVLDFAGTLASDLKADSTWEKVWSHLGIPSAKFWNLHDRYSGKSKHGEYLGELAKAFAQRGLTRDMMRRAGESCGLRNGAAHTLGVLDAMNIRIYIASRSERDFILGALGLASRHVAEVHSNHFRYDAVGVVSEIVETGFDREGKARFVERVAMDLSISTTDVLFIGNSDNDSFARRSGARTLCVCPYNTNGDDKKVWDFCLKDCEDFASILDYLGYDVTSPHTTHHKLLQPGVQTATEAGA